MKRWRDIAEISGRMLDAARRGDWDALVNEELGCRAVIAELRAQPPAQLSDAEKQEKHSIVLKLLADDAAIRDLAQPRLKRLESLLQSGTNARRLEATYRGKEAA